jgi:hypothetical protein
MSSSSDPPAANGRPAQLNGWKEIAAYLGRSVRTVQRWEKDFGLPVRRFGLSKPEGVFALPREVDAWLLTAQGVNARNGQGAQEPAEGAAEPPRPAGGQVEAAPMQPPPVKRASFGRAVRAVLVLAVAAAALWAAWTYWEAPRQDAGSPAPADGAAPADWFVDLDTLVVSDARGHVLWKYPFPRELSVDAYDAESLPPRIRRGGIADIDGDGRREVWFVAKPATGGPPSTALYLFEHNGRLRWTYRPQVAVRFGADTFGPSWIVESAFVTPDPAGGPGRALWAVLYDAALFPSSVQRLDPKTGSPLSAYWTNGSIVTVVLDESGPAPRLLVGACFNERRAGSLSVLDALDPNGSAPAELEKYRCTSCPPGDPLAFLVFPKPARFGKPDASGPVEIIAPMANGMLSVRVKHAWSDIRTAAVGIFTLDSALAPVSVDSADDYQAVYSELVRRGEAPAGAPAVIDPEREFLPILRWDFAARRFVEVAKPAATR